MFMVLVIVYLFDCLWYSIEYSKCLFGTSVVTNSSLFGTSVVTNSSLFGTIFSRNRTTFRYGSELLRYDGGGQFGINRIWILDFASLLKAHL